MSDLVKRDLNEIFIISENWYWHPWKKQTITEDCHDDTKMVGKRSFWSYKNWYDNSFVITNKSDAFKQESCLDLRARYLAVTRRVWSACLTICQRMNNKIPIIWHHVGFQVSVALVLTQTTVPSYENQVEVWVLHRYIFVYQIQHLLLFYPMKTIEKLTKSV